MALDVSIMSHNVFIMSWYYNESLFFSKYESKYTYCLRNSVSIKDFNSTAGERTVLVPESRV